MQLLTTLKDRRRLVRHPAAVSNPKDDLGWVEAAFEAHHRAPLDAIFLTPGLLEMIDEDDETLLDLKDALDSCAWLNRQRSKTIKKQEEDYRALLPTVLRHAKRLYIIDPYFRPDLKQWTDTISICASLMGQRGGDVLRGIIQVHTGDPERRHSSPRQPKDEIEKWNKWIQNEFSAEFQHTLLVSMWKKFDDGERNHDRFLITDQVGFSIAGGLDCIRPPFGTPSDTI
jgi:hypothetical protein